MYAATRWTWTPVGNIWKILYLSENRDALKASVPNDDPNIEIVEIHSWFRITGDKMVTKHNENINGIRVLDYADALRVGNEFGRRSNIRIHEYDEYGNHKEYVFGWVIMCHDNVEHDDITLPMFYTDYNEASKRLSEERDSLYSYWIEPATSEA